MQTASPYNKNKSKTSCLHVPAYVFLGIFLCDFVRENSLEKKRSDYIFDLIKRL